MNAESNAKRNVARVNAIDWAERAAIIADNGVPAGEAERIAFQQYAAREPTDGELVALRKREARLWRS